MHLPKVHRERAIGGAERRQPVEERPQALGEAGRHHGRGDPLGARLIAVHRQDERPHPPRCAVAAAEQRLELLLGQIGAPADRQRQGIAAGRLVVPLPAALRQPIVALRALLLADQVIGERAVGREVGHRIAQPLGVTEPSQRLTRTLGLDKETALARLHPRVVGRDAFSTGEERGCRRDVP